jgi:hypothetical protein
MRRRASPRVASCLPRATIAVSAGFCGVTRPDTALAYRRTSSSIRLLSSAAAIGCITPLCRRPVANASSVARR